MIPLIIVGVLFILSLVCLLFYRWEIVKDETYVYDEQGKENVRACQLKNWSRKNPPEDVVNKLKELYPEDWKRLATDSSGNEVKLQNILYYMEDYKIPAKKIVKKRIQLNSDWDTYEHPNTIIGGGIGVGVTALALLAMTITAAVTQSTWSVQADTIAYEEKIVELEHNKSYITTYYSTGVIKDIDISSTNIPSVIKEHNAEVKDLIKKIKQDKVNLGNPWCNVWINPACKNVDLVRLAATYIDPLG